MNIEPFDKAQGMPGTLNSSRSERGKLSHQRFRAVVEGWQTKPSQGGYYAAETI